MFGIGRCALPSSEIRQRTQAVPWRNGIEAGCVIAGKGYEGNRILDFIRARGAAAVIPPKSNRPDLWEYDRQLYWDRNLIERAFDKLKHRRRIAIRYDRRSFSIWRHECNPISTVAIA